MTERALGRRAWGWVDQVFDAAFGSAANPLRHLGALGFLCFWVLVASGVYLYVVIDTSVEGAHASIDQLSAMPWWGGGWLRSVHRFAADAFMVLMGVHLLREWVHGRFRGFRRFSWQTGVPLIVFGFVCAIGGFWLNWDALGLYSAQATAEWFDALPWLAAPLARNFLTVEAVSDRLFSLFVFVHLGVPLLMLFGLWFHIQRITRAAVWPPRRLALGLLALFVGLAIVSPVVSHGPAQVDRMPAGLRLDWLLLFMHPLAEATSNAAVWAFATLGLLGLLVLPYLPRPQRAPRLAVAQVDADHCNGCRRCFEDCPYAAVTMVPHPNRRVGRELAVVHADLCAACGICAGACPSSTPFRRASELVTGIDMPDLTVHALRERLRQGLARLRAAGVARPIVAFCCEQGVAAHEVQAADVLALDLLCTGMLAPSFVNYALRDGAAGVLVSGCCEGGCEFRLGQRLADERLRRAREPHLQVDVPPQRLATAWAPAGQPQSVLAELQAFRQRLQALAPPESPESSSLESVHV